MADVPVTTSIDSLVKYLQEHGESDTTSLSHVLNVSENTIVDWTNILEKAGIVKITYKVGKMYLSPAEARDAAEMQVTQAVTEVKKNVIQNEIDSQSQMLNNIRAQLENYSRTVKNAETVFLDQAKNAKKALDRIKAIEKEANTYFNSIDSKRQSVTKIIDEIDKGMKALEVEAEQIHQFNLDTSGANAVIDDINRKLELFDSSIKQMDVAFNKMVSEQKSQLNNLHASLREELNALKDASAAEAKKISEYEAALRSYKKKADARSVEMRKARTKIIDEAIRTKEEVLNIYSAASSQLKVLDDSTKQMKDSWGLLAVFDDKLEKIKADLDQTMKELDEIQRQISTASKDLKNPKSANTIDKIEGDVNEIRNKVGKVSKKKAALGKDIDDLSKQ
ncbi:MAG: hypothetical protein QXF01_01070 [Candidatus Micrarchaeaceae archaeon]